MHTNPTGFGDPSWQRHLGHCLACRDVLGDPSGDLLPTGGLPSFKWSHFVAEAPADGEVDVARGVGDIGQLHRAVVPQVTEDRPQKLRLRVGRRAQGGDLFGGVFNFQHGRDVVVHLAGRRTVVLRSQIEHQDIFALLGVDTSLGFLTERAFGKQRLQPRRALVVLVPRVVGQCVGQRFDGQRHGVEADHIRGAVGRRLSAANRWTGQLIDHVKRQIELRGVVHGGGDGKHANAVGDEIGRVFGAHHALAERAGQERFELVENRGFGLRGRDQLNQFHVSRRIEEVNATEAMTQCFRKHFAQFGNR